MCIRDSYYGDPIEGKYHIDIGPGVPERTKFDVYVAGVKSNESIIFDPTPENGCPVSNCFNRTFNLETFCSLSSWENSFFESMLLDFSDSDFESKVKNEDVSILQFSASWCGPCKVLKPIMEKLSDEFKDKANFYYADIDEKAINSASAAAVRGVPTVVVYKKGVEVARKVGGLPEQQMRDFLQENL